LGKEEKLYTDSVLADNINLIALPQLTAPMAVTAQIRYRSAETAAVIRPESTEHIVAAFERKIRAPAPGQSIVFYCGEMVVGGGIIRRTVPEKTEEN
jgi:tRNA-specific 2-thiouridylase